MFALVISSSVSAKEIRNLANPDSVSVEIERMLENLELANQCEPLEVTIFFSVSEDQKIQSLQVSSSNEEVNSYILKELSNEQLPEAWMKGKIYELTVVKRMS
jgi:tRNA U34 2-thiouridine synthase MnmA/TrmU